MLGDDHHYLSANCGSQRHNLQGPRHDTLRTVELLGADFCQLIMNVARFNILIERGSYLREGQ